MKYISAILICFTFLSSAFLPFAFSYSEDSPGVWTTDGSDTDIQGAYDDAGFDDGDTILFPTGGSSETWTTGVLFDDEGFILRGAGSTRTLAAGKLGSADRITATGLTGTTITNNVTSGSNPLIEIDGIAGNTYQIEDLQIIGGTQTSNGTGLIYVRGESESVILKNVAAEDNIRSVYITGSALVVMSKCYFTPGGAHGFAVHHSTYPDGLGSSGHNSWSAIDNAGTSEMVYFEDGYMYNTDSGGLTDGFAGARFCVRYSTIVNGRISTHGTESTSNHRGTRWLEVYECVFEHPATGTSGRAIEYRSGSGVVFNNTGDSDYGEMVNLSVYRKTTPYNSWGAADGRNSLDDNDGVGALDSGTMTGGDSLSVIDSGAGWADDEWIGDVVTVIYDSGTASSTVNNDTIPDTSKSWRIGESDTASGGNGTTTLVRTGAGWTPDEWVGHMIYKSASSNDSYITGNTSDTITFAGRNESYSDGDSYTIKSQWAGYTARNTTTGRTKQIVSNTTTVLSLYLDGDLPIDSGESYEIFKTGYINDNDETTLTLSSSITSGRSKEIRGANGDSYEIHGVDQALDQPGMGQDSATVTGGFTFTYSGGPNWPDQAVSPIYEWGNTGFGDNDFSAGTWIDENTHYFNNTTKPGYAPYDYPHPALGGESGPTYPTTRQGLVRALRGGL